ncbi:MAG: HAD-IA family hydrolase [Planctomycetota bacterium]|nr:HAD-IA family hydrolase [Planctomycetota bacterium]
MNPRDLEQIRISKAIIFDCDGTLVDSMPVHFLAWHQTMSRYGIKFPEDRFYALGGMPSHRIIELLSREQQVDVDANVVAMEKEQAFLDRIAMLVPIEKVVEVARQSRGTKPIAVASGGFREIVLQQLTQVAMADWFDAVVTAEDTTKHKPEPDVFLEAARRLGVEAQHCLVFEDADLGVEAALRAGMPCIDVRTFFSPRRFAIGI